MDELQRHVAATQAEYESAAAKLAEKRACLIECEREHSALAAEKSELQGKLGEAAAERKRVAHRCARRRGSMSTSQHANRDASRSSFCSCSAPKESLACAS